MRTTRIRSGFIRLSLLMLLIVATLSAVSPMRVAHATAAPIILPNPWWWVDNTGAFSQYDSYQYNLGRTHNGSFYAGAGVNSYILSTGAVFQGVAAIGPRPGYGGTDVNEFFTTDAQANPVSE